MQGAVRTALAQRQCEPAGMKSILIEQVANGWIVRGRDEYDLNSYEPGEIHVYRNMSELQGDLIRLLDSEPRTPCPDPEKLTVEQNSGSAPLKARPSLTSHEKA